MDQEIKLNAIKEAYTIVERDTHSYDGYNALLAGLESFGSNLSEELQNVRTSMSSVLLLSAEQWIKWIKDESIPRELIPIIYEEAVLSTPTVELWTQYANFLVSNYKPEERNTTYDKIAATLAKGADATAYVIPNSHLVWNIYRDFVSLDLDNETEKPHTVSRLKQLYLERLAIPHATLGDTFSAFSTFITAYDNDNYENEMIKANKIYAAALKTLQARDQWESTIASNNSLENYAAYIQWEIIKPKKYQEKQLIIALYERVVGEYPHNFAAIWDDYITYLQYAEEPYDRRSSVLERATKACPGSGELWAHLLRVRVMSEAPFAEVSETKESVDTVLSFQKAESYQDWKVFTMAWLYFLRVTFSETQNEEILEQFIIDAESAYVKTVEYGAGDPYFEMEKFLIEQWTLLSDLDQVRKIWNRVSKYHGKATEFWIKWALWEQANGDYHTTVGVFTKAMTRNNLDWPERLFQEFMEYERSHGSSYSIEDCISRCRMKLKYYQWQRVRNQGESEALQDTQIETHLAGESSSTKRGRADSSTEKPNERPTKAQKQEVVTTPQGSEPASRDRENNTVIASNLPEIGAAELKKFFSDCGEIKDINLDSAKHYATIEFGDHEGALAALTRHLKKIGASDNEIIMQSGESTTVWVTNFLPSSTEDSLRRLFGEYGKVISIRFPSLKFNTHRRFCYIQFSAASEALNAAGALNGYQMQQPNSEHPLSLVVKISDPSMKKERTGAIYEDREVFVKGIDFKSVNEAAIRTLFEPYGPIERVRLPLSKGNEKQGRLHDGYCFIVLATADAAKNAIVGLNGVQMEARTIHVSLAAKSGTKTVSKMGAGSDGKQNTENDRPSDINARTIIVTNLADTINDAQLSDVFSKYGTLNRITLRPENESATIEYSHVQVRHTIILSNGY